MTKRLLAMAAAMATLLLPCTALENHDGTPIQNSAQAPAEEHGAAASGEVSLIVCDPPDYETCHRTAGVTPPKVIHSETPAYPAEARRLGMEGVSEVSFVIDPQGIPRNVTTAHSIADIVPASQRDAAIEMDKSAVACVKKFRFKPAMLDRKPVATQVKVKMRFHRTMAK